MVPFQVMARALQGLVRPGRDIQALHHRHCHNPYEGDQMRACCKNTLAAADDNDEDYVTCRACGRQYEAVVVPAIAWKEVKA